MFTAKNGKNIWVLILIMLAGVVCGGFVGELITNAASAVDFLSFLNVLNYNAVFGLTNPVAVDLGFIAFSFALTIRFSIWGVVGMAAAILIYRRL